MVGLTSVLRLGFSVASDGANRSCSTRETNPISPTHVLRHAVPAALT